MPKGFNAVEFDNLDSYQRSRGRLTKSNSVALAETAGQACTSARTCGRSEERLELGDRGRRIAKFDYAIAEECAALPGMRFYRAVYGDNLIEVGTPITRRQSSIGLARLAVHKSL